MQKKPQAQLTIALRSFIGRIAKPISRFLQHVRSDFRRLHGEFHFRLGSLVAMRACPCTVGRVRSVAKAVAHNAIGWKCFHCELASIDRAESEVITEVI